MTFLYTYFILINCICTLYSCQEKQVHNSAFESRSLTLVFDVKKNFSSQKGQIRSNMNFTLKIAKNVNCSLKIYLYCFDNYSNFTLCFKQHTAFIHSLFRKSVPYQVILQFDHISKSFSVFLLQTLLQIYLLNSKRKAFSMMGVQFFSNQNLSKPTTSSRVETIYGSN